MALPKIPVEAAPLDPLPRRLLDTIGEFGFRDGRIEPNRWLAGITWNPRPRRPLLTQSASNVCSPPASTDPAYGCVAAVTQAPFRVYDAFSSTNQNFTGAEIAEMLRERMPAMSSDAFARELIGGAAGSTLSLANQAHSPVGLAFGSGATPVWNALAILETELGLTLYGAKGMIHLPVGLLGQAVYTYGLRLVGDHWETPLGNTVVADSGYISATQPTGQAASPAATDWVYASGPVQYRSTEPALLGTDGNEFITPSTNDILRWMEMYGILKFDPCPVTAVLASYDVDG